jgi:hypothetical protein
MAKSRIKMIKAGPKDGIDLGWRIFKCRTIEASMIADDI